MSNKNLSWVWIVSGPSGSGKTSLCEALLKDDFWNKHLMKSVSYTTRPRRPGEKEGVDYRHIPEEKFLRLKKQRGFLESEKIFGSYYGTPKKVVAIARDLGRELLLCIDVKGARTVKKFFGPRAVSIFILTPKLGALGERLKKRSTENAQDIRLRLRRAKEELSYIKDYDYVVVNDDFGEALRKIKSILTAERCKSHVLRSAGKAYR